MFLLREIGHFQAPITQDLLLFGQKNLDAAIDTCRKINVQKMKFSITDIFSKCDQIRGFLRIWSHLLKKPVMENFIFCAVNIPGQRLVNSWSTLLLIFFFLETFTSIFRTSWLNLVELMHLVWIFHMSRSYSLCYLDFTYLSAQKMKFPIKDSFSKCDLKKSLTENFIFCAVSLVSDFPICFKMGFPSSESSFHFYVLVSIDFLINSKGDALFHRKISDNFRAN